MSALPQVQAAPIILKHQYQKDKAFYFKPTGENFFAFCVEILNMHWLKEKPNKDMADFLASPDYLPWRLMAVCRDSGKSTLSVNGFPIWDVCQGIHEGDNGRCHLFDSASIELVALHLEAVQNQLRYNERLIEMFGAFYNREAWTFKRCVVLQQWDHKNKTRREGTFMIRSTMSEITGLHFTRIEADDWVTKMNTRTDLGIQRGIQHYQEIISVLDKDIGQMRITCTFKHWADAYQHIIKNVAQKFSFFIKAVGVEYERGKWKDLFFPEKFSEEKINDIKDSLSKTIGGDQEFATEYLLQPVAESTKTFADEHYQEVEKKDLFPIRWTYIVYDPAGSSEDKYSRSCDFIGALGVDHSGKNMVLTDGYMKPAMQPVDVLNSIVFLWKIHKSNLRAIIIEDVTFGKFILKMLDDYCREHSVYMPIITSKPERKHNKIEQQKILQPRWMGKGMWFLKELPEEIRVEARDEFMHYPKASYNDLLDGIVMVERMTRYMPDEIEKAKAETKAYIQAAKDGILQVSAEMFFDQKDKPEEDKQDDDEMTEQADVDQVW